MMTKRDHVQLKAELVMLEQLVKEDHLLRKIEKHVSFGFIYDLVEDYYADTMGRPSIDPVVLFKMSLIQTLYGIPSERRLAEEIHHNMAYRWFLGYGITDQIPDHTTISYNRTQRFKDATIYETILNEVVLLAMENKLVSGKIFYTDSTHIRANASNSKYTNEEKETIITEDESLLALINDKRVSKGQKPLKPADDKVVRKNTKISTTDPSSGYMHRDRKPVGFYHLVHGTVDGENNIILGLRVTPGNVHDSTVYIENLDEIFQTLEIIPTYVGADAGYFNLNVLEELAERNLTPVIGPRKYAGKKGKKSKYWFEYDPERDEYTCFEGQRLKYVTTTREGYVEYRSDPEVCRICPKREKCLYESGIDGIIQNNQARTIRRHIKEHYADEMRAFMKTPEGKALYQRRKETIERVFADMKELCGMRYAHYRGSEGVKAQALVTATALNVKKIATILDKRG